MKNRISILWTSALGAMLASPMALAVLGAPSDAGGENLLGASADGAETGLYEITDIVETGIELLIAIVVVWAAYRAVRMFISRSSRGG